MKTIWSLCLMATIAMLSGCNTVSNSMRISEKNSQWNPVSALVEKRKSKSDDEELQPETMAAIWKDSTLRVPGEPEMKGFGGRIFFYDASNNAVPAEGELVVYGFDGESTEDTRPNKKFVFKQSQFQEHFSESPLGGSYSVWIPWEKIGGFRKSVTLIPIFKTADNRLIKTGQSINILPGKKPDESMSQSDLPYRYLGSSSAVIGQSSDRPAKAKNGVTRASYNDSGNSKEAEDEVYNRTKIRVSEIPLTRNLRNAVEANRGRVVAKPLNISTNLDVQNSLPRNVQRTDTGRVSQRDARPAPETKATDGEPAGIDNGAALNSKVSARKPPVFGAPSPFRK